jgi:hypothetical protein
MRKGETKEKPTFVQHLDRSTGGDVAQAHQATD